MIDVVIVTQQSCLVLDTSLPHNPLTIEEDGLMIDALKAKGLVCRRVGWEDPDFDWSTTRLALIKTPWNYSDFITEFREWVERISQDCLLVNSKEAVLWNMDKNYLLQLQKSGVPIPETHLLDSEIAFDPAYWNARLGVKGIVVKPTISAGAKNTLLLRPPFDKKDILSVEADKMTKQMIVQPFLESITTVGELSLIFIDGQYTHAMLKVPKENDFRVQSYHGGRLENHISTTAEINFSKSVIAVCESLGFKPLYVRIDICYDDNKELLLMEVEAIEPELWFRSAPKALEIMVSSIVDRLQHV